MTLPMKAAAHLAVLGAALVTAGLRPSAPASAAAVPLRAATYHPPAFAAVAPGHPKHAARAHRSGSHRAGLHRAGPREATLARAVPAARPATRATHRRARPAQPPAHRPAHPRHVVHGPTGWAALDAAIARIPTYRAGAARWVVSTKYGHWGTADWYHDVLYVAPSVPSGYLYDVAVHEWSHELSVLDYAGDVSAAVKAMDAWFGGSGLTGAERAADCMAIVQGATWTHYTSCGNARWRAAAARLVRGERL